jgi:hypothetical protein
VTSLDCQATSCSGTVRYSFTFLRKGSDRPAKDRGMAGFTIERGKAKAHVTHQHVAAFDSSATIDDVAVDSVDCSSP